DARVRYSRQVEQTIRARDKFDDKQPLTVEQTDELKGAVNRFMQPVEAALWKAEDELAESIRRDATFVAAVLGHDKKKLDDAVSVELRGLLDRLQVIEKKYLDTLAMEAGEDAAGRAAIGSFKPMVGELKPDATIAQIVKGRQVRGTSGKPLLALGEVSGEIYVAAWDGQRAAAVKNFGMSPEQAHEANRIFRRYAASVREYLQQNREAIAAHFGSLDRFEQAQRTESSAAYQKHRDWDEQQKLRAEAGAWLNDLDAMGAEYRGALWNTLTEEQKAQGSIPVGWTQSDLMDLAVTWGLTAIGFCMIVGLCNRLACLGGAAFLISVLLTQPPWPTIYPPAPEVVGHALIVDKNFVEMMAMLALACLPVGRWGGLDAFLWRWFGRGKEGI
ncbi:MAG TPA: hypothetical protein VJL29_00020, partial [Thermoguttaceae bacterium]|nr:hypothetical protein [Thermoguttaceae bacterium]